MLDVIPAVYENGVFRPLEQPSGLSEHQTVQLYVVSDKLKLSENEFDITKTTTWQLCGMLEIAEPDPEYVVGRDEQGNPITNYAEHVDDVLYG
jgi:predicted DNA-binding antitoxin AbrB/MazE fold protein